MNPLKLVRNVLLALTGQTKPTELAGAVALGMMIAIIPKGNLIAQSLILLAFLLGINTALALAVAALFLLATPLTDRLADPIGYALLVKAEALRPAWTWLYNRPLLPWTAFNNTVVLGSTVLALLLYMPVYLAAKKLIEAYRERVVAVVSKWRVVQLVKASYWFRALFPGDLV